MSEQREAVFRDDMPSVELLSEFIYYEKSTGKLFWIKNSGVNKTKGLEAGRKKPDGYLTFKFQNRMLLCHRVAWALHFGEWPSNFIDHINSVRDDNRIENLQVVTRSQNNSKALVRKDNKLGVKGVHYQPRDRKYIAQIRIDGKQKCLGYFSTIEAAKAAYAFAQHEKQVGANHE